MTRLFLIKKFREYYSNAELYIPDGFRMREWAFVPLEFFPDFLMIRHISFSSDVELKAFILDKVPAHAYYSSAYYRNPSAEMDKKGWIKSDLIFDIDADHLPRKSLENAKKEVFKLIKILTDDFGISEEDIEVVFSGHRGYHVHVYDEAFKKLQSAERREIVDYLTLRGFKFKGRQMERFSRCLAKGVLSIVRSGKIDDVLRGLSEERRNRIKNMLIGNIRNIERGDFSIIPKRLFDLLKDECISKLAVYIDPPVTSDIKRLIRLPNSLHGKTGLKVTVIPLDKLEEFSPFRDAVVFGSESVKVRVKKKVKLKMMDQEFLLHSGKERVPEYLAVFLMCRGVALYGH